MRTGSGVIACWQRSADHTRVRRAGIANGRASGGTFGGNLYSVPARKVRPCQLMEIRATKSQVMLRSTVAGSSVKTLQATHPRAVGRVVRVVEGQRWDGLPTGKGHDTTGDVPPRPRHERPLGEVAREVQGRNIALGFCRCSPHPRGWFRERNARRADALVVEFSDIDYVGADFWLCVALRAGHLTGFRPAVLRNARFSKACLRVRRQSAVLVSFCVADSSVWMPSSRVMRTVRCPVPVVTVSSSAAIRL